MGIDLAKVTDKTAADFEGLEPDYEAKLEFYDQRRNHNKFWHIAVYSEFVVRRWGRHGSKGQSSVHRAYNNWGAKSAAQDLSYAKRNKGYVEDKTTILDHIARKIN